MDFIVDGLGNGRMVRILSVVDAYEFSSVKTASRTGEPSLPFRRRLVKSSGAWRRGRSISRAFSSPVSLSWSRTVSTVARLRSCFAVDLSVKIAMMARGSQDQVLKPQLAEKAEPPLRR